MFDFVLTSVFCITECIFHYNEKQKRILFQHSYELQIKMTPINLG